MFGRRKQQAEKIAFVALDGAHVDATFDRKSVSRTLRYSIPSPYIERIGELVDVAAGAAPGLSEVGLIHRADVARLVALLHSFRGFQPRSYGQAKEEPPAESSQVGALHRLLKEWTMSLFDDLGPTAALFGAEAASYLHAIAFGAYQDHPKEFRWQLTGQLEHTAARGESFLNDKKYKKMFTERLRGAVTLLVRPDEDVEVRLPMRPAYILPAGSEARFVVWRCPISSGATDQYQFYAGKPELLVNSWPFGGLVIDEDGTPLRREETDYGRTSLANGVLPWRWVIAHLARRGSGAEWVPVPAFDWKVVR